MAIAMITNFFKKATPTDIEEQKKRDAMYWAKRKEEEAEKLARDEERRMAAQKAKRPVGRPKMKRQFDVVLISPVEEVEVEELPNPQLRRVDVEVAIRGGATPICGLSLPRLLRCIHDPSQTLSTTCNTLGSLAELEAHLTR